MDMQQLGYFLFMEDQENQRKEKQQIEVNVELDSDLVGEFATTKPDQE